MALTCFKCSLFLSVCLPVYLSVSVSVSVCLSVSLTHTHTQTQTCTRTHSTSYWFQQTWTKSRLSSLALSSTQHAVTVLFLLIFAVSVSKVDDDRSYDVSQNVVSLPPLLFFLLDMITSLGPSALVDPCKPSFDQFPNILLAKHSIVLCQVSFQIPPNELYGVKFTVVRRQSQNFVTLWPLGKCPCGMLGWCFPCAVWCCFGLVSVWSTTTFLSRSHGSFLASV